MRTTIISLARAAALAAAVATAAPVAPLARLAAQPTDTTRISTTPLFTRRDAYIAGGFVVATAVMAQFDDDFARRLQDPTNQSNRFLRHQATNFRLIGDPGTIVIGAAMYGIGRVARNERMADLGLHGTEALFAGMLATGVLKSAVGRARPYKGIDRPRDFGFGRGWSDDGYRSFPSGHSTMGFAAAAAVTAETNRWWPNATWVIGPAMYGGAALIGASRMYNNKHWASDVVMGAAIGTFAGLKVTRYHHSHPGNRIDKWLLGASIQPGANGGTQVGLSLMPGFGLR